MISQRMRLVLPSVAIIAVVGGVVGWARLDWSAIGGMPLRDAGIIAQ
jgi:uncharacterized membrane protein